MKTLSMKKSSIFLSLIIIVFIIALVMNPEIYMQSTLQGILVWATAVLPALFPFFFLTKILTQLGLVEKLATFFEPVTKKLFNTPGIASYIFLMSMISGYPVGAKITSELYENKAITKAQAVRMCSFCSTSGPLFVIGTVGLEAFGHKGMGVIMLVAHLLGAIVNGLVFRFYKRKDNEVINYMPKSTPISNLLANTIYDSVMSILIVGGYIALFFMIIDILTNLHILTIIANFFAVILNLFGVSTQFSVGLSSGIIEVTRGCLELAKNCIDFKTATILATGLISWGGISIHFQALTFLKKCEIKTGFYMFQKLCHCVFSMIVCWLLLLFIPI